MHGFRWNLLIFFWCTTVKITSDGLQGLTACCVRSLASGTSSPVHQEKEKTQIYSATEAEPLCLPNSCHTTEGETCSVKSVIRFSALLNQGCSPHTALPFQVHAHRRLIPKHHRRISQDAQGKTQLEWETHRGQVGSAFTLPAKLVSCHPIP